VAWWLEACRGTILRCSTGRGVSMATLMLSPASLCGGRLLRPFPNTDAGKRYVLLAMDYFTKWPEAYRTVATTAKRLVEEMFAQFGVPAELHSDQGRNFVSQVFGEVCRRLGVSQTRTTALHPQSDGLVERFNSTLATQLAIRHQWDPDRHLPLVLWSYRTAVQESSRCTPAALMLGRELRTPVDHGGGAGPPHSRADDVGAATWPRDDVGGPRDYGECYVCHEGLKGVTPGGQGLT